MRFRSRLARVLLALSTLVSLSRAQQYCVSGTVSETHLSDLKAGDAILFTAKVQSGSQSCTTNAGQTTCSAIVLLEIQSGKSRWNSAALNGKAATIQFIFSAGDTTTRVIFGAVVGQSSPPQALTPFNMLGVHIDLGTYSGNFLANGGFPSTLPSISNHPFEPASIYLTGPGGNTTISYTGQGCADTCPTQPATDDIVLYQNDAGQYVHVAVIAKNGVKDNHDGTFTITQVISKWGDWGLYGHDPDDTLHYGKTWTVWHAKRKGGNKLRLLNGELFTDAGAHVRIVGPDTDELVTELDVQETVDSQCPGLYERLDTTVDRSQYTEPIYWTKYDCKGWVFAPALTRISDQDDSGGDQMRDILRDNNYCQVPASHTGGHGCSPLLTRAER